MLKPVKRRIPAAAVETVIPSKFQKAKRPRSTLCLQENFTTIIAMSTSAGVAFDLKTKAPVIAQKAPFKVDVEAGKTYYWCSCGRSKNQPFCDGSHEREQTGLSPIPYTPDESKTVWFCGCKQSSNKPFCDGTHSKLS